MAAVLGVGPITASAIAAAVPVATVFRSGRQFAVWLGLTPRPSSSGGKDTLLGILKQGDGFLRRLLVVGATAVTHLARRGPACHPWLVQLLERKAAKFAAVALVNKMARIVWALLARGGTYTNRIMN